MSGVAAGVDGGGTRSRVLLVDRKGRSLGVREGPPSLVDPFHPEASADVVAKLVREAAAVVGVELPLSSVGAGIAGTGREDVRAAVELALVHEGLAERVSVFSDVEAAFHDAFADGPGLLLVAGTGSIAWGRSERGETARVGGWGSLLGDEGSGYAIGLEVLRRVARSADGRGVTTALVERVLATAGLGTVDELVEWVASAEKGEVAALVPLVAEQVAAGDSAAREVLEAAAEALDRHIAALFDRLGPWEVGPAIALSGGLLGPSGPLRPAVEAMVERRGFSLVESDPDPLRGALLLGQAAT